MKHGLESQWNSRLPICDFWCSRSTTDFNSLSNSLNETKNSLASNVYPLQGEDFLYFDTYRLQIAEDESSELP